MRPVWDGTDAQLAAGMRRLKGQICTLSTDHALADEVRRRGLMQFHEWPSGHWDYTGRGLSWLCHGGWQ